MNVWGQVHGNGNGWRESWCLVVVLSLPTPSGGGYTQLWHWRWVTDPHRFVLFWLFILCHIFLTLQTTNQFYRSSVNSFPAQQPSQTSSWQCCLSLCLLQTFCGTLGMGADLPSMGLVQHHCNALCCILESFPDDKKNHETIIFFIFFFKAISGEGADTAVLD